MGIERKVRLNSPRLNPCICVRVDDGEGFEEGVEDSVDYGRVDGCECYTGIEEHELEGPPEGFGGNSAGAEVGFSGWCYR